MSSYVPDRNDLVWLNFKSSVGKEEYRKALVLSSCLYNLQTGLLICCPISTSIRGALTEVAVNNLDCPSVVTSNLVHTLPWGRKVKFIAKAEAGVMAEVLFRLMPLLGIDRLLQDEFDRC